MRRTLGVQPVVTAATGAFFERSGSRGLPEQFKTRPATMDELVKLLNQRRPAPPR